MKKCNLIIFIFISSIWVTYGQIKKNIDSINLALQQIKVDTVKVIELNELAWKYKRSDSIGRLYANQALQLSRSISFLQGEFTSLYRLSIIEYYAGDYFQAEKYAFDCIRIGKQQNNIRNIFKAKFQLTKIYDKLSNYDKALKTADESISIVNILQDSVLEAKILSVKGTIYENKADISSALIFHKKSMEIREQLGKQKDLARSYLKYAKLLASLKKYQQEFEYLQKGRFLCEFLNDSILMAKFYNNLGSNYFSRKERDSAIFYYEKSLFIKEKKKSSEKDIILANIGNVYQNDNQLEKAKDYYFKSLSISRKEKDSSQIAKTLYNLGLVYFKQKLYDKSIETFQDSYNGLSRFIDVELELNILISLAESYEKKEDFKNASIYNEKHIILRNNADITLRKADSIREVNEKLKQEKEIKDQKLLTLKANEETQEVKFYAVSGLLIIISILFFVILKFRKEKREKEIITQKNIELLKKQELKSIKAMIDGQEKERKRIAQDLHDRLGSMLSMVKLHYKSVEDSLDKLKQENKNQYEKASMLLDEACDAVREIAHEMISGVLTKFGLTAALEELKETIESSNTLEVELITYGLDDRLENKLEMEIYGIIQELIHNVIKHAKAKELSIQLLKKEEKLQVIVEDDGVGFDIFNTDQNDGMGLKSVYSRVDDLFGEIAIDSGKGKGTTITIQIPLEN